MSTAIVEFADAAEAFLARCVPDLKADVGVCFRIMHARGQERSANGRGGARGQKGLMDETVDE